MQRFEARRHAWALSPALSSKRQLGHAGRSTAPRCPSKQNMWSMLLVALQCMGGLTDMAPHMQPKAIPRFSDDAPSQQPRPMLLEGVTGWRRRWTIVVGPSMRSPLMLHPCHDGALCALGIAI